MRLPNKIAPHRFGTKYYICNMNITTQNYESYSLSLLPSEYTNSGKDEISITYRGGNEERKYHPLDFLNELLDVFEERIEQCRGFHAKYDIALEAKTIINNQIETFNGMLWGKLNPTTYNFSSAINKANNLVNEWKDKLENRKAKREWLKFFWGYIFGLATAILLHFLK